MNSDTMRTIDRLFGPALCYLVSALFWMTRPFRGPVRVPVKQARRMLFVKPAEMGTTVLMYSAMQRARKHWPGCEFHFLVFNENRDVDVVGLLGLAKQEHVHTLRTDNIFVFAADAIQVVMRLRRLRFDVAIDMEFFSRASSILTALSGAPVTAGFHRYTLEGLYKGNFLTCPVQYNPHIHTAATFVIMIDALTQEADQRPLAKIPVPPHAVHCACHPSKPPRRNASNYTSSFVKRMAGWEMDPNWPS